MKLKYLSQNSKIKSSSSGGARVFNFGIPAIKTCIGADKCKAYCYAAKGAYTWPVVKAAYQRRYDLTKSDCFCETIFDEIVSSGATHVRIHDSGDFYSREYLAKWLTVIDALPHVQFYAYTKSIPLFLGVKLPENFHVIFSHGGKYDHLIKASDNQALIFEDKAPKAYVNASKDDLKALESSLIALIMH